MKQPVNPYAKTRHDHSSETSEDYVEAIYRLVGPHDPRKGERCESAPNVRTVEIARSFAVAQPTATKVLSRLEREGLVCIHRRQHVHLTQAGESLAVRSLERHQTVVALLKVLGVSPVQAELDAEGVEHHVSEESLEAVRRFLKSQAGTPRRGPALHHNGG